MVGPPGPMVYSLTSGTLVEPSAGGSWSIVEAFLWHWAEELERLLATHGEEVCRVGEERDRFWRELDKAQKEWDLFDRGPLGLEVASIKPNQGAWGPVGGGVTSGIGMFGVGLIGGVDLVPEKLVKGSEVLSDFMGSMGGDVLQGQGESGVVAFVGVEGGDSSGGVGCAVESAVGDNVIWESVLGEYVFEKQFGELWSIVSGVAGDEEGLLGEVADNDEDHVKTFGIGEFDDMIHQ
ncbi:hypothetical protein C0989_006042 [Termitomyces sp. Mn162]|nr:hypothetical protein C0989_006042 [Termitomyces sp. Mn162]